MNDREVYERLTESWERTEELMDCLERADLHHAQTMLAQARQGIIQAMHGIMERPDDGSWEDGKEGLAVWGLDSDEV